MYQTLKLKFVSIVKQFVSSLSSLLQCLKNKMNHCEIIEQIIFSEFTCSYNERQLTCVSDVTWFCSFVCFGFPFFICYFIFHLQTLGNHKYKYLYLGLLLYDFDIYIYLSSQYYEVDKDYYRKLSLVKM